jgi:single-strand DNA-binding protein
MSFAKISIIGNLGADPELKYTADGKPRLEMRVATNERRKAAGGDWEDKTTWYRVIMFGERSVKLAEWLRKGRKVYAEGRLQVDMYDSKEGEKRVALDILASEVVIVDRNPDADSGAPRAPRSSAPGQGAPEESNQSAPSDLDDLPF